MSAPSPLASDKPASARMLTAAVAAGLFALAAYVAADVPARQLAVGRVLGAWALLLLVFQPVLALRLGALDRAFGQDRLLVYHRWSGAAALGLAFLHPLFVFGIALPPAGPAGWHLWREAVGGVALVTVWLLVVSSSGRRFLRLSWEAWRRLHAVAGVALAAALVHMAALSGALQPGRRMALWGGLLALVSAAVLRYRLFRRRCPCTVESVRQVAEGVTELTLAPDGGRAFPFLPGQFAYLKAGGGALSTEEHPFTLASAATDDRTVRFAVKASGDWTSRLHELRPGDRAQLHGPFGRFTPARFGDVSRLVLVAGGIGVTPMLSVLRTLSAEGARWPTTLVWSCRTEREMPYREELRRLQDDNPDLAVHLVLTREKGGGRLAADQIVRWVPPHTRGTHAMVCGPENMIRDVTRALRTAGYPRRAIHAERFSF